MMKPGKSLAQAPRYFLINKSEPRYDLLKSQLLDTSPLPAGTSHYFVHASGDSRSLCRIRAGNGTVLFYEIIDHTREGISDDDLMDACCDPDNASPVPEYFFISQAIDTQLRHYLETLARETGTRCQHRTAA